MPTVSGNVGAVFNGGQVTTPLDVALHGAQTNSAILIDTTGGTNGQYDFQITSGYATADYADLFAVFSSDAHLIFDLASDGSATHQFSELDSAFAVRQLGGATVFECAGNKVGFYGAPPVVKATVSGSKGANAALASLMTALVALGLVTDSTT